MLPRHGTPSGCRWSWFLIWIVVANVLNKHSRATDKGWSCSFDIGRGNYKLLSKNTSTVWYVMGGELGWTCRKNVGRWKIPIKWYSKSWRTTPLWSGVSTDRGQRFGRWQHWYVLIVQRRCIDSRLCTVMDCYHRCQDTKLLCPSVDIPALSRSYQRNNSRGIYRGAQFNQVVPLEGDLG